MKTKAEWRAQTTQLKQELTIEEWQKQSDIICEKVWSSSRWQQAEHIALYYSMGKEVYTHTLLERGWQEGKHMYLPVCEQHVKTLLFYKVDEYAQLEPAQYGILEPKHEYCQPLQLSDLDIIIVPGVVFDSFGYRIGYGGGYYDRFLQALAMETSAKLTDAGETKAMIEKWSLAFQFQVSEDQTLPREAFDIPVDYICTEQKEIHSSLNRRRYT